MYILKCLYRTNSAVLGLKSRYSRVDNVVLTQSRPIKMSKFPANIFLITSYFQLLLGLRSFQKSVFKSHLFSVKNVF